MRNRKIDYVMGIKEQFGYVSDQYPDFRMAEQLSTSCGEIGFVLRKDSGQETYHAELNEYIGKIEDSGELEELRQYWFQPGDKETVRIPEQGASGG